MNKPKSKKRRKPEVIRAWVCCHKNQTVRKALQVGEQIIMHKPGHNPRYPNPDYCDRPVRIIVGGKA